MNFATVRMNAVSLTLVGILLFSGAAIGLRLRERIQRGEQGQDAIQMLDAMRRPFLAVQQAEALLLETGDAQTGNTELSLAIASATELLERYKALARYSVVLSTSVSELFKGLRDLGGRRASPLHLIRGRLRSQRRRAFDRRCHVGPRSRDLRFLHTMESWGRGGADSRRHRRRAYGHPIPPGTRAPVAALFHCRSLLVAAYREQTSEALLGRASPLRAGSPCTRADPQ